MEDHGPSGSSRHPHPHPHCSFVLLAEFDIDRGSTLAHVYPNKDLVKEHDDHTLAELMLPDGAHARSEDWTVFLIKNPSQDTEHPHVTYVLNLVRTKHDDSVRRGALVKAIAIGTHHPCIHVFKPILLLALDDYFDDPGPSSLARLYDAINSLDLTPAPSLTRSEKLILRANDRNDFFLDRFHNSSRPGSSASHHLQPPAPTPAPPHLPRDTHFWDTSIQYAKMDIPIKWPMDAFEDEVGEVSVVMAVGVIAQNLTCSFLFSIPFPPSLQPFQINPSQDHYTLISIPTVPKHRRWPFSSMPSSPTSELSSWDIICPPLPSQAMSLQQQH